jgi:hypothetical protein
MGVVVNLLFAEVHTTTELEQAITLALAIQSLPGDGRGSNLIISTMVTRVWLS